LIPFPSLSKLFHGVLLQAFFLKHPPLSRISLPWELVCHFSPPRLVFSHRWISQFLSQYPRFNWLFDSLLSFPLTALIYVSGWRFFEPLFPISFFFLPFACSTPGFFLRILIPRKNVSLVAFWLQFSGAVLPETTFGFFFPWRDPFLFPLPLVRRSLACALFSLVCKTLIPRPHRAHYVFRLLPPPVRPVWLTFGWGDRWLFSPFKPLLSKLHGPRRLQGFGPFFPGPSLFFGFRLPRPSS